MFTERQRKVAMVILLIAVVAALKFAEWDYHSYVEPRTPMIAWDLTSLDVPVAEAAGQKCLSSTTLWFFDSWLGATSNPYQSENECEAGRKWRRDGGDRTRLCHSVTYCFTSK